MRRRTLLAATGALFATPALAAPALARPAEQMVDVLLLLAVDVSRSMDEEEARLQREGYAAALADPHVHAAIEAGPTGAIGLAYFEWSGPEHQSLLLPWTRIGDAASARAAAARLAAAPLAIGTWTSISSALDRAGAMMGAAPFAADRKVIDVSGDGMNNSGGPLEEARDRAVTAGIVINGLPVMKEPTVPVFAHGAAVPLDQYYRENVAGGFGSFVLPAEDFHSFGRAVRRKLILEIAALPGPGAAA